MIRSFSSEISLGCDEYLSEFRVYRTGVRIDAAPDCPDKRFPPIAY